MPETCVRQPAEARKRRSVPEVALRHMVGPPVPGGNGAAAQPQRAFDPVVELGETRSDAPKIDEQGFETQSSKILNHLTNTRLCVRNEVSS